MLHSGIPLNVAYYAHPCYSPNLRINSLFIWYVCSRSSLLCGGRDAVMWPIWAFKANCFYIYIHFNHVIVFFVSGSEHKVTLFILGNDFATIVDLPNSKYLLKWEAQHLPNFKSLVICVHCPTGVECIRRSAPSSLEFFPNPHCNAKVTLKVYTNNQKVSSDINARSGNKGKSLKIGNNHAKSES